jgi:UDP-N-acetylglucosamine acyltransferase
MPRIHPTAIVDPTARLADDVIVGAYCVVEGDVAIGSGCELRPHAIVRRYTTLGSGNFVDSFAVLGGLPQDLKFDPSVETHLRIGDRNTFRESVTISRATRPGGATVVGSGTYWMANSHAGHDTTVEDRVVLANSCAIGGHATVHARAILSGSSSVHQFTWVGELVMTQGLSGVAAHTPPYTLAANINEIVGLNTVGLRRAPDLSDEDRRQIKHAFCLVYRAGLTPTQAVAEMDRWADITPATAKFRDFIREVLLAQKPYHRALAALRHSRRRH